MAVPKKKTSKQKRNQRRAHDFLTPFKISENKTTGEKHLSHRMSLADGYYNGRQILVPNPILEQRREEARAKAAESSPAA